MEDYFREKFKNKTEEELRQIVNNQKEYQKEAVIVAHEILGEEIDTLATRPSGKQELDYNRAKKRGRSDSPYTLRTFFKTWGYRNFSTIITLNLVLIAFQEIIVLYSSERIFEGRVRNINLIALLVILIIHHLVYKKEHGRQNNFLGRSMNDLLMMAAYLTFRTIHSLILGTSISSTQINNLFDAIMIPVGILIFIGIFELILSGFKWFFSLFNWNPF